MARMTGWRRGAAWTGGVLLVAGLGVFLSLLGLDRANQTAGVLSLFVSLAGLGVSAAAYVGDRRVEKRAAAGNEGGGSVRNEISGGNFHGTVLQVGRISGQVKLSASEEDGDDSPRSGESEPEPRR
ncbi:hypothetical protein AB0I53_29110 [Saccharopolyspora sp. NPDC050389]|uniref:hypothetical protein n=1 Tax=Saccharopolyspora sp. NPDC050389 TaxID=3155516 RepID=UPI0033C87EA8